MIVLAIWLLSPSISKAQYKPGINLASLTLNEILTLEIAVSSVSKQDKLTLRDTPGIVTIITQEEIQNSGARNLIDILRLVPSIEISGEEDYTFSIGVRGNTAREGKMLLMIDGIQLNESRLGSVALGDRILPDAIKQIEIIRGPGSAIYGGLAELAVINIITKDADLNGGYASVTTGTSNGNHSRTSAQFGLGKELENGLKVSLTGNLSQSNRSNETQPLIDSFDTVSYNYRDSSTIKNVMFNLKTDYKGLSLQTIYQSYLTDYWSTLSRYYDEDNTYRSPKANYQDNSGLYTQLKYNWSISDQLTITPNVSWKQQAAMSVRGNLGRVDKDALAFTTYRVWSNVVSVYKPLENVSFTLGSEFYRDILRLHDESTDTLNNGLTGRHYQNYAGFAEAMYKTSFINIIAGLRYDHNSDYGDAWLPRLALTKAFDNWHIKLLGSRAFKAPLLQNIEDQSGICSCKPGSMDFHIKPEFTTVGELELGYLINESMSLTLGGFYSRIDDPIIYAFSYFNGEHVSTTGLDVEYRLQPQWGYLTLGYSYYRVIDNETDYINEYTFNDETFVERFPISQVLDDDKVLRGYPSHKLSLNASFNLGQKWIISPSGIFNSSKTSYGEGFRNTFDGEYLGPVFDYDPSYIVNLSIHYLPVEGVRFTLSGYDLLDDQFIAGSTSNTGLNGVAYMGREITFKASYEF